MSTPSSASRATTARGLATVAMLKAQFDEGKDHLEMFMPFVVDTIVSMPTDDMVVADLRETLYQRHGLVVPTHIVHSLMARGVRRGLATRVAGRYLRSHRGLPSTDILQQRGAIEAQHQTVARSLRDFAASKGTAIESDEDALALIMGFLEDQHILMILCPEITEAFSDTKTLSRKDSVLVARFLEKTFAEQPVFTDYIRCMLEGFVLQNTLLLRDIGGIERKFENLNVYYDTGVILRALGMCGDSAKLAALESFDTLRASNARLFVFEKTVQEVERVLRIYIDKLGTSDGIRSLYPTEVTRYVVTHHLTPSDVAVVLATLRQRLTQLGLTVHPMPAHVAKYTFDEAELSRRLLREGQQDISEPRIVHDVDCTAAILTLRAGRPADSLDRAKAVFATNTSLVAQKVRQWFRDSGETGLPPVVSEMMLSNAAWLRRPASAHNLKLHQLVALCSAALQPTRHAWASFVRQLKELEASRVVSSEWAALAVVVQVTEDHLAEVDEESDVDADTVAEIIERVRETYRAEFDEQRAHLEQELAATKQNLSIVTSQRDAEKSQAETKAGELLEERARLQGQIAGRAKLVALIASFVPFSLLAAAVGAAWIVALPGLFPASGFARLAGWALLFLAGVIGFLDLVWGKHLAHLRSALERAIHRRLCRWLLGCEP